jgi:rod shape-determining protein MreC
MQQIIKFFIRFQVGILFIILLTVSLALTINAHSFHQQKFISSTTEISGYLFEKKYSITSYFNLKKENADLQAENNFLKEKLSKDITHQYDRDEFEPLFTFKNTNIISNSYRRPQNIVVINKGSKDSIQENYGVSLPVGILGIVQESTSNFSRVISILNTKLSINAKFKNNSQFGSLQWDGKSPYIMQLNDIPRSAVFNIGDTIVTGGNSLIFPKNLLIGKVKSFEVDENLGYYYIDVELFADMTNLNEAYVIIPNKVKEALPLLNNYGE